MQYNRLRRNIIILDRMEEINSDKSKIFKDFFKYEIMIKEKNTLKNCYVFFYDRRTSQSITKML